MVCFFMDWRAFEALLGDETMVDDLLFLFGVIALMAITGLGIPLFIYRNK